MKDAVRDEQGKNVWKPVGQGAVDYKGHLEKLFEDDYREVIALETHCTSASGSKIEGTKESLDGIMKIIRGMWNSYLVADE